MTSSLVSTEALNNVISYFISIEEHLVNNEVTVLFETDFQPSKLSKFIENFSRKNFGINYDIGNSAALGYDPDEEFAKYGEYIKNVHVKDRPLGGVSCLLGTGDAKFDRVVKNIKKINYGGDFVMQTARSKKGQHYNILKDQLEFWQSNGATKMNILVSGSNRGLGYQIANELDVTVMTYGDIP